MGGEDGVEQKTEEHQYEGVGERNRSSSEMERNGQQRSKSRKEWFEKAKVREFQG